MSFLRHPLRLLAAVIVLFVAGVGIYAGRRPALPRVKLKDGREFQVLQVKYGSGNGTEHAFGRAPEWRYRVWRSLPWLQRMVSRPAGGVPGIWVTRPMISIWCVVVDPATQERSTAVLSNAVIEEDDDTMHGCPNPFRSNFAGSSYMLTELYFDTTPTASRHLRFWGKVEGEPVTFTMANPAYGRPIPPGTRPDLNY